MDPFEGGILLLINFSTELLNSSLNVFDHWLDLCGIDSVELGIYVNTHIWQLVNKVFYIKIFLYNYNNYQFILIINIYLPQPSISRPTPPLSPLSPNPLLSSFCWYFIHHTHCKGYKNELRCLDLHMFLKRLILC